MKPVVLIIVSFLVQFASLKVFDPVSLFNFRKLNGATTSPDGSYAVYSVTIWDPSKEKESSYLRCTNLITKESFNVTEYTVGVSDSNPVFSEIFPDFLVFLRSSESRTHIFSIHFPPSRNGDITELPSQLSNYPIDVSNLKWSADTLVFTAEVYFNCITMDCTAEENNRVKEKGSNTWQIYTKLFVRHWDRWLPEGKGTHLFVQRVKKDSSDNKLVLQYEPSDIFLGFEDISSPPLDTGAENFDISPDGNEIAFSGLLRNRDEAWNTNWKTYRYNLATMIKPLDITMHTTARTQNPRYSKDGTKIAYLAMKTPMLESDNLHLEIYNIFTNQVTSIPDLIDRSIIDFNWYDDTTIFFIASDIGLEKVYLCDINVPGSPIFLRVITDEYSYNLPVQAGNQDTFVAVRSSFSRPKDLCLVTYNRAKRTALVSDLTSINDDLLKDIELPQAEMFFYKGGYNEQVQGWMIKPIAFDPLKKYPLSLLINGGPENSWSSSWGYRWNPQIWTNRGYVVVIFNPHGSTGMGINFQNAIRNDWGGVAYDDIMGGVTHVLEKYHFIDENRMCAAGASFGGYMVNWIQGHSKRFKCLVTHDGTFSTILNFYSTEELWFAKAEFCPRDKIGCNPYDSKEMRQNVEKNSPERFVNNWSTPHLVIHGNLDYRISITEALSTFTALQLKGVPSKLLYYPQENHWVLKIENAIKWYEEVIGWMDTYTK